MKQKVVAKAIIKQDSKILLIRRSGGRPSILGLYELPGGRVHIHQQPDDALRYGLKTHLGVVTETTQLVDVMTYIDPDDRELQYVFIVFAVSLQPYDREIVLTDEYDKYIWKKMSEIQRDEITQSTQQILGMEITDSLTDEELSEGTSNDARKTTNHHMVGYSDGGSRGNPGPAASGFVLIDTTKSVIAEEGVYLGIATNNVAEYQAVYLALTKALELGARVLDMRLDSLLVVNQMNGIYKIKNADLLPIHNRIKELVGRFERVTFTHVMREYNTLADGMVNKALDQALNTTV